jgi:hypothetical protein
MRGGVQVGGYGGEFVADRADRIGAQRQAQQRVLCADLAARLFIGVDTVKKHLTRVLAETACATRTQLALRYAAG